MHSERSIPKQGYKRPPPCLEMYFNTTQGTGVFKNRFDILKVGRYLK